MHEEEKKLADVHPEHTFKTNTGKEIKNLRQLLKVLNEISHESFEHHVKNGKNDFAKWIRHSVKDDILADMIERTTEFEKSKQIINDRIALLEKKIEVKNIKKSLESLKADTNDSMGISEISTDMENPEQYNIDNEGLELENDIVVDSLDENLNDSISIHDNVEEKETSDDSILMSEDIQEQENSGESVPIHEDFQNQGISKSEDSVSSDTMDLQNESENQKSTKSSPFKVEHHPFEHIKNSMHITFRNILFGVVIGLIVGYLIGAYL